MSTGIDHVVILVEDLEKGIAQYEQLGFTVTPGGKHARFTHNALITFHDGSYIELIAFYEQPDANSGESHRWFERLQTGGGIIDYALAAPGLDVLIANAESRGITTSGVTPGSRTRLDGQQLAWRSAIQQGENVGALPFLIEDVTDRTLRVPIEAADHKNQVRGIRSLVIAVSDVSAAAQRYQSLLNVNAPSGEGLPNLENADGVYFLVGAHRIDLAAPTGDGDLKQYVERRGDCPYELSLLSPETVDIEPSAAAGARLRLVAG